MYVYGGEGFWRQGGKLRRGAVGSEFAASINVYSFVGFRCRCCLNTSGKQRSQTEVPNQCPKTRCQNKVPKQGRKTRSQNKFPKRNPNTSSLTIVPNHGPKPWFQNTGQGLIQHARALKTNSKQFSHRSSQRMALRAVLTVRSQSGHSQVTVRSTVRSQSGHVFCGHVAIFNRNIEFFIINRHHRLPPDL